MLEIAKDYKTDPEAAKSKWIDREISILYEISDLGVWDEDYVHFAINKGDAYVGFRDEIPILYKKDIICVFCFDGVPDEVIELRYGDYMKIKGVVKSIVFTDDNVLLISVLHSKIISRFKK